MNKKYQNLNEKITAQIIKLDYLYTEWAKKSNENSYLLYVVYMIYSENIHQQKDIIKYCGMPKQTVNNVIRQLIEDGYATTEVNPEDKRSKLINLTTKGKNYAHQLVSPLMHCEFSVLEKLGEARVNAFIETLQRYSELFENEMLQHFKK